MPITLIQDEMDCAIKLEGSVDISVAAELKQILLEALASGKRVRVSLAGVTDMDVTAVQLLWAAVREAKATDTDFAFDGDVPEPVLAALVESGFEQLQVPA